MPRRRMFDPDFWTDSKVAKFSRDERLLFIGLFTNADDEGRIMANPAYLKSIIFPYDDDITTKRVKEMLDHITQINSNVLPYNNHGDEYIQLQRWQEYQSPRYPKPSKLPPPPSSRKKNGKHNGKNTISEPVCNQKDEALQPNGAVVKVEEVVNVKVIDRDRVKVVEHSAPTSSPNRDILKTLNKLRNWKPEPDDANWLGEFHKEFPDFNLDMLVACRDYYSGRGPPKQKGGWKNRIRNWMLKAREFKAKRGMKLLIDQKQKNQEKGPAPKRLMEA